MRLPFIQMESDLLAHGAPQVASLAGCLPVQALGHIAFLRAWAVAQATDESPPDGWARGEDAADAIEAAAQWAGEPGRLLRALKVAKLVEVTPEGVRVLGLEPYVVAWNKNAKAKERMANARARSANVRVTSYEQASTDGERSAKFGRQMQTQMEDVEAEEKNLPASQVADVAALQARGEELPDVTQHAEEVPNAVAAFVAQAPLLPEAVATPPEKPAFKGPDPEALRALWNRLAPPKGLARWEAMNKARTAAAKASLLEVPDLGKWEAWLTHELDRPFNRGDNPSGWRADVDWLLRAKTRGLVADFDPSTARATPAASETKPTKFLVL